MRAIKPRTISPTQIACILLALLAFPTAHAAPITPTWAGSSLSDNWTTDTNWTSPASAPGDNGNSYTDTAYFHTSAYTAVSIVNNIRLVELNFLSGASQYTLTNGTGGLLAFGEGTTLPYGIVNQSGIVQTIINTQDATRIDFQQNSDSGSLVTIENDGLLKYQDAATGTNTTIVNGSNGILDIAQTTTGTSIGRLSGGGTVSLGNSSLSVGSLNNSDIFSGVISDTGNGQLIKMGSGTLTLTGANTYAGLTTISAGTLQIGNNGTTGTLGTGNTINSSILSFYLTNDYIYNGVISGIGVLNQIGSGTTVLAGSNTYSGLTTISAGVLQLGNGGALTQIGSGAITNNAALAFNFNAANVVTYNNTITGSGTLTKTGAGRLILNGANSYTGSTTVNAGSLIIGDDSHLVTPSVTSNITVNANGALGGNGTVTGNVINNGYFSPGVNFIGDFYITENYTQAGGNYNVDVDENGTSDSLNVTGTTTLTGGTVTVNPLQGGFKRFYAYRILNTNTLVGTFSNTDVNGKFTQGFLTGQILYNPSMILNSADNQISQVDSSETTDDQVGILPVAGPGDDGVRTLPIFDTSEDNVSLNTLPDYVEMIVDYNPVLFSQAVQTPNQQAVSNYLMATLGTPSVQYLISTLTTDQQLRNAFDQISGATYANQNIALAHVGGLFSNEVGTRLSDFNICSDNKFRGQGRETKFSTQSCQNEKTIWMTVQSGDDQLSPGAVSGLNTTYNNLMMGFDMPLGARTTVGAGFAYNDFQGTATGGVENANYSGQLIQLGLYGRYQMGDWLLGISVDGGTTSNFNTQRNIQSATGLVGTTGDRSANIFSQQIRGTYDLTPRANFTFQPFLGFITQQVDASGFNEQGGTGFELTVNDSSYNSARSQVGIQLASPEIYTLKPFANLSWEHEFSNTQSDFNAQLSGLGEYGSNAAFHIVSTPVGRDAAVIDAGVILVQKRNWNIAAAYEGRFANNWQANLATLQANVSLD